MSDRDFKDQGNKLFLARRYEDAITCYTKAIVSESALDNLISLSTDLFDVLSKELSCT